MLAGGYAVQAHGLLQRVSEDVDLFTNRADPAEFQRALEVAVHAWQTDGLSVVVDLHHGTFARLTVTDEEQRAMKVELGYDWRAKPPARLSVGLVLHRDDAVANKVCTVFSRGLPRDYIDVYASLTSGAYSTDQLISLAAEQDPGFDPAIFSDALRASARYDDYKYTVYGLDAEQVAAMRSMLSAWADELTG
ncbi:nucleotidyl transferase AbiEii/AbiGii toxin family protein [Nocardia macrotermitis]|uniref:nucleotidyl transferase AbiEii/AbiGii toxin family protein n=1 Tax=Nocardia macrotermitis TaxID=2585198 RepID=UPI0029E80AA5|nr:nucleotidyl transferase AbiEii/AbiGii toxin family protein [Nocardia macrotermitis]